MNKKGIYALFALMIVGAAGIGGAMAYGDQLKDNEAAQQALEDGDYDAFIEAVSQGMHERFSEERFDMMADRYDAKQAMDTAIENGDYDAWRAAFEAAKPPSLTELVTEDNFDTFVAFSEAMENGDYELAKELADSLGFEPRGFGMHGIGKPYGMGHFRGHGIGC